MSLLNQKVIHKAYGIGTIVAETASSIEVQFDPVHGKDPKMFVYPSCFAEFLYFEDDLLQAAIQEKLQTDQPVISSKEKHGSANVNLTDIRQKTEKQKPRLSHISIDDSYRFPHSVHIANACFGKNYKGWQRAAINLYGSWDEDMSWFPKLAVIENGIEVAQDKVYGCINVLSDDGLTIYESHSSADGTFEEKIRYVFAKPPGEPYRYVGNFQKDNVASTDRLSVYRRVGTDLDLSEWCNEPLYPDTPVEYYIGKDR